MINQLKIYIKTVIVTGHINSLLHSFFHDLIDIFTLHHITGIGFGSRIDTVVGIRFFPAITILDDIQSFKSDKRALPRILWNSASFEVKG